MRSDNERSLLELDRTCDEQLDGCRVGAESLQRGINQAYGLAEVGVREIKAQTRMLRSQLEQQIGNRIGEKIR